ncbi:DUF6082 family protein (plasmid) [Streptomyces sp. NBC_01281]|uniref:DUF6082 family protein n=1 Tax=Streptomyces sp. NBC_01281 TaxID=2903811 RepID=UPI002E0E6447|nr:DUF6082 family protein [Streptomyces sp. NBC_01281]
MPNLTSGPGLFSPCTKATLPETGSPTRNERTDHIAMKLTSAVLTAGATVALAASVVGAARLRQSARHQNERKEALLAQTQLGWLTQLSSDAKLAELWKPEGMETENYMGIVAANRQICMLSLRYRLGFVSPLQLALYAEELMDTAVCRRYWAVFGELRAREAIGDVVAERFTEALARAAEDHPADRTASV